MGVLYRASMQHHICLLLWTPVTIMTLTAMVTRLAIHPGETEAEWMTVTVAFTQGSVSVTKAFRSETTHRHTHALETSKTITGIDRVNCVWLSIWRVYSASECIAYKSQDCEQLDTTSDQSCIKSEWEKEKTTSVFTTQQANTWKAIKVWNCTVKLSQLTFTRLSAARQTEWDISDWQLDRCRSITKTEDWIQLLLACSAAVFAFWPFRDTRWKIENFTPNFVSQIFQLLFNETFNKQKLT